MILQAQLASDMSLHEVMNFSSSNFFGAPERFLFSTSFIIFGASKPISACYFRRWQVLTRIMCASAADLFLIKLCNKILRKYSFLT